MSTPAVTINFTLQNPLGVGIPGKVVFTLVNYGSTVPSVANTSLIAKQVSVAQAAADGTGTVTLWGSYQLNATNSFYQVAIYGVDDNGVANNAANLSGAYQFNSPGTFDLSNLVPINSYLGAPVPQPATAVVTNPIATQSIATFPLSVVALTSASANTAAGGVVRLAHGDSIDWRNNANNGDLVLHINTSDDLVWGSVVLGPLGDITGASLAANGATPTGAAGVLSLGNTTGFGNGSSGTAVTTTTKSTGSGPAAPQTIVKYLEIDLGGTKYWLPLVQ